MTEPPTSHDPESQADDPESRARHDPQAAASHDPEPSARQDAASLEAAASVRGMLGSMTRRRKLVAGIAAGGLALIVIIIIIIGGGSSPAASRQPAVLPVAKSFSLHALGRSGQSVSLSQYAGRPLVVNFFASWCDPCKKETPLLARFYRAHHGQVVIIGVDVNDSGPAALSFVQRTGVGYPVGTDPTAATAIQYGVAALPQTFFLNAHHQVVKLVFGAVTQADLNAGLARMR
jgi:cytochrome c biogenesis protein CcmG/thiol:disulfide interchange protein DsbE